jgi:hypothetical protein
VANLERFMNILNHHLPNAFRSASLFEQIGGKRRRFDIGKSCSLIATTSSASRPHIPMQSSSEITGMSSSLIFKNYIVNRVVSFDQNQSRAAGPICGAFRPTCWG